MFKTILDYIKKIIDFILPPRTDFEIVKRLKPEDIYNLPKAQNIENQENIISLFEYRDKRVKAIIWELKYKENTSPLDIIGKMMFDEIINIISDIVIFDINAEFLLIPVPISQKSRVERGFNQTEYISKSILNNDEHRMLTYSPQWLTKIKDTEKQSHSGSKEERKINLENSFLADDRVSGKYVFLIDDVVTTGSTIYEIKKALLEKGAVNVFSLTIAH